MTRRQDQGGGHSIPDEMGDKLGDKTGEKRKARPARRTQHLRPDGTSSEIRPATRTSIPAKADTVRKH